MAESVPLNIELIAHTSFTPPTGVDWDTDAKDSSALLEFAGRACYETWDKPNVHTAQNADYIRHLLDVGHMMVFEHASATMYLRGISRASAHEIMRHRMFSFSELSPRYVPEENRVVIPELIQGNSELEKLFESATDSSRAAYEELLSALIADGENQRKNTLLVQRQARQAARTVLSYASETHLVMTGNFRSWRHFIATHAVQQADPEIRRIALECLRLLKETSPEAFEDFFINTLADGSQMASSPYTSLF